MTSRYTVCAVYASQSVTLLLLLRSTHFVAIGDHDGRTEGPLGPADGCESQSGPRTRRNS